MSNLISPINTAAIDAIPDENIRLALRSIADMLVVRNGHIGSGEDAFVTRKDIADLTGLPVATAAIGNWPVVQVGGLSQVVSAVSDIESAIINSAAFQDLGTQVSQANTNIVAEQNARIAAVQQVANDLIAEAIARGDADTGITTRVGTAESNITSLQTTTSTTTTNLSALTTRVSGAESNITSLQTTTSGQATSISNLSTRVTGAESTITSLQTTTSTTSTNLSALTTRVGTAESNITSLQSTTSTTTTSLSALTTRVGTAESNISNLTTTTGNQATAISSLTTTVGTKVSTFYQSATPTANAIGDIWFDTGNNSRPKRWSGSAWVDTSDTRIASVQAAITSEATTRADQDNAITSSMNSQFSTVNSNISALQTTTTTLTNNYSSLSSSVSTLSTTVSGHTTSISNEVTARQTADGLINAKYSVKIDSNGYVSGYGLISEANNSTPVSSFIVRADKFAIGSPSGPGITPALPFSVLTSTDADGNPPGVYIEKAFIKKIKAADIDSNGLTLKDPLGNVVFHYGTGLTRSVCANAELQGSAGGWSIWTRTNGTNLTGNVPNWIPPNTAYSAGAFGAVSTAWNGTIDSVNSKGSLNMYAARTPVTGGQRLEAQALVSVAGGFADLCVSFLDENLAYITNLAVTGGATRTPDETVYGQAWGYVTAPSNARWAYIEVYAYRTRTDQDTYLLISKPFIGAAGAAQIERTPWHPGFPQIWAGNSTVYIADATIDTQHVKNAAIKYAQIGDAEIGTLKIAGNAVTVPRGAQWIGTQSFQQTLLVAETTTEDLSGSTAIITASAFMRGSANTGIDTGQIAIYKNGVEWATHEIGRGYSGAYFSGAATFVDTSPGTARYGVGFRASGYEQYAQALRAAISVIAAKR